MSVSDMITTRITFVLEDNRFAAWQLNELKQLAGYFHSLFVLYNITRGKQANLNEPLCVLSLGSCRHDVCQLAIEGLDAELACMVLTEYLKDHSSLLSTSHKQNFHAAQLFTHHSSFKLPFSYQWHYVRKAHYPDKNAALATLARLASSQNQHAIYQQLVDREAISSTAIPGGIAIPHIISECVQQPTFIIQSLDSPLDWDSPQEDVRFIIALLLPKVLKREYIIAATRLTRWLINPKAQHFILDADREETIKGILLHVMAHIDP